MHTFLKCNNCKRDYYPQMLPSIIVLVTYQDKLLVCHRRDNIYTNVTGFVELAESAEQTVYRELNEEIGLKKEQIKNLKVLQFTQFWPSRYQSLMLAYHCELNEQFQIQYSSEVKDAKWIEKQEFLQAGTRSDNDEKEIWIVPKRNTIARMMMEWWFDQQ